MIKLYRLIGIILMLESQKQMTARELAKRFEISTRTVYRDLEILSQVGIPIVTESGPGGGISLMGGFQLRVDTLSKNEFSSIIKTLVDQEIINQNDDVARSMILKIKKVLPREIHDDFHRLINSVKVDPTSWDGKKIITLDKDKILDTIKESILKRQKIIFDYTNYQRITRNCYVHPYGLVKKAQTWYLVGYCEERNEIRVFHLMRIQNLKASAAPFTIPHYFDLNEYWEKTLSTFQKKKMKGEEVNQQKAAFPVKILCSENQRAILGGFNILQEEMLGDKMTVTADFISEHIAMQQLLFNLDTIIILEPEEFKTKILEKAKKITENQNC